MTKRLYHTTQFFDGEGQVLAAGTINTYEAGTSTPKATYTDRTGNTANANPVVLDSEGRAQLWLDTDGRYKFVIKDSGGTTLETIDEVAGVPEALSSSTTVLEGNLDISDFAIVTSANKDLTITPNGTGDLVLDGLNWPQADGTSGQVLTTDGAGQLSWTTTASGSMNDLIDDTTPQLGGDLDTNSFNIQFDSSHGIYDDSSNEQMLFTKTTSAVNYLNITNSATSNPPIIAAAGGDSNIDLSLQPKAGGNLILDTLTWPNTDGTNGQVLTTDGSGTLSFGDQTTGAVLQVVYNSSTSEFTLNNQIPFDNTTPQSSEGDEILTQSITPNSASNLLEIEVSMSFISGSSEEMVAFIVQDSNTNALITATQDSLGGGVGSFCFKYFMTAGTTSSTTFKLRAGTRDTSTAYINRYFGGSRYNSTGHVFLSIKEYSA